MGRRKIIVQWTGILACTLAIAVCAACLSTPAWEGKNYESETLNGADVEELPGELAGLHAQSAVLMDGATGRVLFGRQEDLMRPMASTTKIMTCILALELGNPEDLAEVSANAASQPKVHLGVREGERYRLRDLLYSLMLESHNDSAVVIAEHIGGSVEGFAKLMNKKARDIGCTDTNFITPNGLDAVERGAYGQEKIHGTTARDLALIMRYCVSQSPKAKEFLEVTGAQDYYFTDCSGKRSFNCCNHNAFLSMMNGMLSGKTGFTGGAGYSYVAALEDQGRVYIISLLGCGWPPHKTYKWSDARKLFGYGMEHYQLRDVYRELELPDVQVTDGIGPERDPDGRTMVGTTLNLPEDKRHIRLLLSEAEQVKVKLTLPRQIEAPVRQGQEVGEVAYYLDGQKIRSFPVYTDNGVPRISYGWCLSRVFQRFVNP